MSASTRCVDNWQYRLLRAHTPGPYTFLLKASRETPRRLKHERRGTIGLRVPDHPVTADAADRARRAGDELDAAAARRGAAAHRCQARSTSASSSGVDLVLDGGNCGLVPTSVIDLSGDRAEVVRVGRGDVTPFGAPVPV